MNEAMGDARPAPSSKKVVSRAEALWLMIASAVAAAATTVANIVADFAGPVALTLPLATTHQAATGLRLGAAGHFASIEAIGANQGSAGEGIIFSAYFNVAPLMAGIVLTLVAAVFQFGGRLQKDTEGLV